VRLTIHDVLGREIATLVDGTITAGRHVVRWDASPYPSGLYLVRLKAKDNIITHYMMLIN